MNRDELRRLAIRLAMNVGKLGIEEFDQCSECGGRWPRGAGSHPTNCPIAELEAEEARSKLRPVEPKRNPEDEEPGYIRDDGVRTIILTGDGWSPETTLKRKTAGEYEGELS